MAKFKIGDKVALKRDHLWAPAGAMGIVTNVYDTWDTWDTICWELGVLFPAEQTYLNGDKPAGLYIDDVKRVCEAQDPDSDPNHSWQDAPEYDRDSDDD